VINAINAYGTASPPPPPTGPEGPYCDVDGDGVVAPNDALEVINHINAFGSSEGEGTGVGSQESGVGNQGTGGLSEAELLALLAVDVASQPKRRN